MPPKDPVPWEDSFQFTQFILSWCARERSLDPIVQIFVDERRRRRGLRAYGISPTRRRSVLLRPRPDDVRLLQPANFDAPADAA